jgi:hypothetical protein
MKHTIEYSAVKIEDVLKAKGISTAGEGILSFICADGYAPVLPMKKAVELGLLLAYRDRSAPKGQDWNKFPPLPFMCSRRLPRDTRSSPGHSW